MVTAGLLSLSRGCLFITYEVAALDKAVSIDTSAILQEKYKSYIYLRATPSDQMENFTAGICSNVQISFSCNCTVLNFYPSDNVPSPTASPTHAEVSRDVSHHYSLSFLPSPLDCLSCLYVAVGLLTDLISTSQGSVI